VLGVGLERVSTGLHILQLGRPDLAAPFLETAELLAWQGLP
jgi:hypothetical protein